MRSEQVRVIAEERRRAAFRHTSGIKAGFLLSQSEEGARQQNGSPGQQSKSEQPGTGTAEPAARPRPQPVPSFKPLPQFRVMLHNDERHEMDHVVRSIVELTPLPRARAYVVMLMAHTRGLALVLITHRERAELYQQQFRSKGLTVTIEAAD